MGGIIAPTVRSIGVNPSLNNRVPVFEQLKTAVFEQTKFYEVETGQMCWIYLSNWQIPRPNVKRNSIQTRLIFPPLPPTNHGASNLYRPHSFHDLDEARAIVRSI